MAGANEQRLTQRLIGYWNLIKKEEQMPLIERFNTAAIEDLWHQCMMVSVDTRKGVYFKCEFMGDQLIKAYGRDICGEMLDSTNASFPGVGVYKRLESMVDQHAPQEDAGFFLNKGGDMVKYRACFLPFGSGAKGVTNVVIGLSFRAF